MVPVLMINIYNIEHNKIEHFFNALTALCKTKI